MSIAALGGIKAKPPCRCAGGYDDGLARHFAIVCAGSRSGSALRLPWLGILVMPPARGAGRRDPLTTIAACEILARSIANGLRYRALLRRSGPSVRPFSTRRILELLPNPNRDVEFDGLLAPLNSKPQRLRSSFFWGSHV